MFSLYIHIPFCDKKCGYCTFHVVPTDTNTTVDALDALIRNYVDSVCAQITQRKSYLSDQQLKTIYFGGGTPTRIGKENLMRIIDHIITLFDVEQCMELSIEINPYPPQEMLDCIKTINKTYKQFPRIRRSIGIQTFDNAILQESSRQYTFPGIVDFLRDLVPTKYDTTVYNFDFIAFGKFSINKKGEKILWDETRFNFFQDFVRSGFADSFSVYTLELFPGSSRYEQQRKKFGHENEGYGLKKYGTDDDVYNEFHLLTDIIQDAGYRRYEISNFSAIGKNSIHNRVYRNRENYIGIGTSAASFWNIWSTPNTPDELSTFFRENAIMLTPDTTGIRRTNTRQLTQFTQQQYIDPTTIDILTPQDALIEAVFLGLRTDTGLTDVSQYASVLAPDRKQQLQTYHNAGRAIYHNDRLILTYTGRDMSNTIITSLLQKI